MITTENIPTIVTSASERNAGCMANIRVPMPINMINADTIIELRYEASTLRRHVYSYEAPSVIKIV